MTTQLQLINIIIIIINSNNYVVQRRNYDDLFDDKFVPVCNQVAVHNDVWKREVMDQVFFTST